MVAWGGIEPPTQGFSIPNNNYLTELIVIARININQRVKSDVLDKQTADSLINIRLNSVFQSVKSL